MGSSGADDSPRSSTQNYLPPLTISSPGLYRHGEAHSIHLLCPSNMSPPCLPPLTWLHSSPRTYHLHIIYCLYLLASHVICLLADFPSGLSLSFRVFVLLRISLPLFLYVHRELF